MHTTASHFWACTANVAQGTITVYAYALGPRTNLLLRTVSGYAHAMGFVTAFDGKVEGEYRVRVLDSAGPSRSRPAERKHFVQRMLRACLLTGRKTAGT